MRRAMFAVLFTSSLLASAAHSPGLFDPLWGFLSSIWRGAAADAGCGADPYGRCGSAPQPTLDTGCGFDPYGQCGAAPQPTPDEGCGFDPYGHCTPGS